LAGFKSEFEQRLPTACLCRGQRCTAKSSAPTPFAEARPGRFQGWQSGVHTSGGNGVLRAGMPNDPFCPGAARGSVSAASNLAPATILSLPRVTGFTAGQLGEIGINPLPLRPRDGEIKNARDRRAHNALEEAIKALETRFAQLECHDHRALRAVRRTMEMQCQKLRADCYRDLFQLLDEKAKGGLTARLADELIIQHLHACLLWYGEQPQACPAEFLAFLRTNPARVADVTKQLEGVPRERVQEKAEAFTALLHEATRPDGLADWLLSEIRAYAAESPERAVLARELRLRPENLRRGLRQRVARLCTRLGMKSPAAAEATK
jgi:hypothetical protein